MIYEIDLLDDDELKYVNNYFNHLTFKDGKISNRTADKECVTAFDGAGYLEINRYCSKIIYDKMTLPYYVKRVSQIYYSKYEVGGRYEDHHDHALCGGVETDYSMTCFLNDEYDGGELVITIGNFETKIKLKPGKAVLYPSNLLHRVNEVTSGRRDVFCCWIQSAIKDTFMRNHIVDYGVYLNSVRGSIDPNVHSRLIRFRTNLVKQYGNLQ